MYYCHECEEYFDEPGVSHEFDGDWKACPYCGDTNIERLPDCPLCGNPNTDDSKSKFCPKCRKEIDKRFDNLIDYFIGNGNDYCDTKELIIDRLEEAWF